MTSGGITTPIRERSPIRTERFIRTSYGPATTTTNRLQALRSIQPVSRAMGFPGCMAVVGPLRVAECSNPVLVPFAAECSLETPAELPCRLAVTAGGKAVCPVASASALTNGRLCVEPGK